MSTCFFVSDLHGSLERYRKLFDAVLAGRPDAVFFGGDLLPHAPSRRACYERGFIRDFLAVELTKIRSVLQNGYPRVFIILGNDDGRSEESALLAPETSHLWEYIQDRRVFFRGHPVYGYAYVPPTPFRLKDWERYDVSRYVDPGCISPEEGSYSVPVPEGEKRYATIQKDIARLTDGEDVSRAIFLFHSPPHRVGLDRIAHHPTIDHAPMDPHVGSVAIRRFIERRQPLITLHGHVHESARLTGTWRERIGRTHAFSAAHDGPELALVTFFPEDPEGSARILI